MKPLKANRASFVCVAMAWIGLVASSMAAGSDSNKTYVTWPPIEPDKVIAAWLIKTHVAPNARFVFVERGAAITNGIPFDIPGAEYARDHRRSTSEAVIQVNNIKDSKAKRLASLARRIEIAYWAANFTDAEIYLIAEIRGISSTTNFQAGLLQAIKLVNELSIP